MAQQIANRNANLARGKYGGRDLIQQGLEQVVVFAIDQHDFRWRMLEHLGRGHAAKASADDDNYR